MGWFTGRRDREEAKRLENINLQIQYDMSRDQTEDCLKFVEDLEDDGAKTVETWQCYSIVDRNRLTAITNVTFTSATEVMEFNHAKTAYDKHISEENARKLYAKDYPDFRFLTGSQVNSIRNRFRLLKKEVKNYSNTIPVKHQEVINSLTLQKRDAISRMRFDEFHYIESGPDFETLPAMLPHGHFMEVLTHEKFYSSSCYSRENTPLVNAVFVLQEVHQGYLLITQWVNG